MNLYGLIGFPLTHSFSKKFFTEKFEREGISGDNRYELFEMEDYTDLLDVVEANPDLRGINVTIPHKQNVLNLLDDIDEAAERIGAVNVIKITEDQQLIGFNSDYYGFSLSLEETLEDSGKFVDNALILGDGGAAKAVKVALEDMEIDYKVVSRSPGEKSISYADLPDLISSHQLIINATPLGTFPNETTFPDIPYDQLTADHVLFDLVYNPAETVFLQKGKAQGATVVNGHRMLILQAEKSWEIWNEEE